MFFGVKTVPSFVTSLRCVSLRIRGREGNVPEDRGDFDEAACCK